MSFLPDLLTVVEWATVIVTFAMMGSVIPLCLTMYRTKSTTNVPYTLFLVSAFLTALSLQYGLMVGSGMLILINTVGAVLWGIYISVYILVSKSKGTSLLYLLGVVGLYLAHVWHLNTLPPSDQTSTFGMYMMVWVIIISVLPAGEILTIIQEKSTNCCDLPMLLAGTSSAAVWCLYGYLIGDVYIYIPSVPGLTVSFIKFGLMLKYGFPSSKAATKEEQTRDGARKDHHNGVSNGKASETLRQRK